MTDRREQKRALRAEMEKNALDNMGPVGGAVTHVPKRCPECNEVAPRHRFSCSRLKGKPAPGATYEELDGWREHDDH
jgi:hypothetical protein